MKRIFLVVISFALTLAAQAQNAKGNLFIIGGGDRSDALIKQMVATSNFKANDYIIVLPMASEIPDTGFKYISLQLKKQVNLTIKNFNFNKHDVNDKKWIDSLTGAKLIYILGGDQNRFMKSVLGTPVYTAIHKAYNNGSTIAGTSAGAAVMSKYMITGKQLLDTVYKETFNKLWDKNVEFAQGLGLLQNTIIDQHFLKRNRYNRLISSLAAHPDLVCVGIDEGTAIIVHGNKATVAGDSQVIRFAVPKNVQTTSKGLIKFSNAEFGVFTEGDVITIKP
ncbi:cyanophycinase [Pedobacter frigiditerrae]|uniref:Cyanophycinase n=1 Tax=Pedobacter frigiditerrae TaxID=2530452 RepID=A0A4R0MN37_9SPHI|nr:cyanophycinase [Pedobacter frigiditerrae]TCC88181.1 cyanophycinase [Pedobacter frigiditerrae]